jgi:hypothetical protein
LLLTGTTARTLNNHTLENAGTATWSGTFNLNSGGGAVVRNLAGATFTITGNGSWLYNQGGTQPTLENVGTLSRQVATDTALLVARLTNTGSLDVQTGTLRFGAGSTGAFQGSATVAPGAILELGGGTFVQTGTFQVTGDLLVANNGALNPAGFPLAVTGTLGTALGGSLVMTTASDSVQVGGASFTGAAGSMTTGVLRVSGDFAQSGTTTFQPSGTHRTVLMGSGTQNISFGNATNNFFRRLVVPSTSPRSIVLQTSAQVTDSLIVSGGAAATDLVGAGTSQVLTVGGVVRLTQQTSSPRLAPPVLVLSVAPSVDPIGIAGRGLNPDTTVYSGSIASLPTGVGLRYKSLRVNTSGVFTMASDTIANDLHVSGGTAAFSGTSTFLVQGKLRTSGTGILNMSNAAALVTVSDSAIFGGASTSGHLTAGLLRVLGHFRQGGGSAGAFNASGAHQTEFTGTAPQNVSMANPGTGTQSHFNQLRLTRAGGTQKLLLQSNLFAALVVDTSFGNNDSIMGTGLETLTADSIQLTATVFNNVPLVLSSPSAFLSASSLRFENMDPAVTQLTINRGVAGTSTINGITFASVPTTGKYFAVNQTATATLTVDFANPVSPAPAALTGLYTRSGSPLPTVIYGGVTLP